MFIIDKDDSALKTGVWASFQGAEFKMRHVSNLEFQRTVLRLQQPYRRKIENGTLDPKISKEIVCQAMSQHILTDWKKVFDKAGAEVSYGHEIAFKALVTNEDLREFVSTFSTNLDNFIKEESAELGND